MTGRFAPLAARVEDAPYPRALGVRVEAVDEAGARLRVPYKDENSNPGRALHGGVPASAIAIAGALAARAGLEDGSGLETAVLDLAVDYLAAAIGEDIVAEAAVLRRGKELVYVDVDVRTDAGKRIAKGLVTHRAAPPAPPDRRLARAPADLDAGAGGDAVPELARFIVATPFMARLGLAIAHMHDGRARVALPQRSEHGDGEGATHPGALAALLDTAGAMASWSVVGLDLRSKAATVGITASFHERTGAEDVVAHARTLRRIDEIFLSTVVLVGRDSGRVVATGGVTYRIVVPR
ncbi:MAG TPA: PaaI family thioesterase [Candidatus Binatia bacterium]|nr:PaaI family thioesterase [Candidatus Binatia bacterium]